MSDSTEEWINKYLPPEGEPQVAPSGTEDWINKHLGPPPSSDGTTVSSAPPQYSGLLREPLLMGSEFARGALHTLGGLGDLIPRASSAEALAADPNIYAYGGSPIIPTSQELLAATGLALPQSNLIPQGAGERYGAAISRGLGGSTPLALAAPAAALPILASGAAGGLGREAGEDLGLPPSAAEGLGTVAGLVAGGASSLPFAPTTSAAQDFLTAGIPLRSIAYTGEGPLARFAGPAAPVAQTELDLGSAVERTAAQHGDSRTWQQAGEQLQKDARSWIKEDMPRQEDAAWEPVNAKIPPTTLTPQDNFENVVHQLASQGGVNRDLIAETMPSIVKNWDAALRRRGPTGMATPDMGSPEQGGAFPIAQTPSWQDATSLRSSIGDMMRRPTVANAIGPDILDQMYAALTQDLRATAYRSGAVGEFDAANVTSNSLRQFRDNVLGKITTSDTGARELIKPEDAAKSVLSSMRSGDTTLGQLRQNLPDAADELAAVHLRQIGLADPTNAASPISKGFSTSMLGMEKAGSTGALVPNPALQDQLRAMARIQTRLHAPDLLPSGWAGAGLGSLAAWGYANMVPGSGSEDFIAHLLNAEALGAGTGGLAPTAARYLRSRMATSPGLAAYGAKQWSPSLYIGSGILGAAPEPTETVPQGQK